MSTWVLPKANKQNRSTPCFLLAKRVPSPPGFCELWPHYGKAVGWAYLSIRCFCISPEHNLGMNYTGAHPPYPPPSVPHPQAVSWHKKKTACRWKWSGASPSSEPELFAFIPLCLVEGQKPAKQTKAAFKITILKQGWEVQTSWADFHRRERVTSSGRFLLLPSAFSCPAKVRSVTYCCLPPGAAGLAACRPLVQEERSPVFLLSSSHGYNNWAGKGGGPSGWEPTMLSMLWSYRKPTQRCLASNPPPKVCLLGKGLLQTLSFQGIAKVL